MDFNRLRGSTAVEERAESAWNDTRATYPRDQTLTSLFHQAAASSPDAVAAEFHGRQVTYDRLRRDVVQLARHLVRRGVGPGARVGVCIERSIDMLVALLAVLETGAAYVPLDPAYPAARVELVLQDAGIRALLTQQSLANLSSGLDAPRVFVDADREAIEAESTEPVNGATPGAPAYVIYTSGSTGKPKGVVVSNLNLVNFLWSMRREPGLTSADVVPAITTISFDIATLELFLPLIVGARIVLLDRTVVTDGRLLAKAIRESGASLMQATPATWRMLLDAEWKGGPGFRALCGGEALTRELADRLLTRCDALWNMYGPTETTVWSAACRVEAGTGAIPIGRPIANTQIYVLDAEGRQAPVGAEGEICIGGDGVSCGYLNRPELTDERFVPDPFAVTRGQRLYRTGDLGRRQDDGTILFVGRADFQVKIRGYRIELGEIEEVMVRHPRVSHTVAAALDAPTGGKRLVAYYSTDDGRDVEAPELRGWLRQHVPEYMVPSAWVHVPSFPLTPNGKVDRQALTALGTGSSQRVIAPARDDVERALVSMWEQALAVAPVGITDDFFDLGGHSLVAVRIFAQIARRFGRNLPLSALVGAPTIARLAPLIRQGSSEGWRTLVTIQPHGTRRPLFIVHGGGGTVLFMRDLGQQLGTDRPVHGLQSEGLDGRPARRLTVEAMASHYLAAIRAVQPQGPYLLGGYCYGGIVAFEMAQQLLRHGEQATLVALFNAPNRAVPYETIQSGAASLSGRRSALAAHMHAVGELTPVQKVGYVGQAVREGMRWRGAEARSRGRELHQQMRRRLCWLYLASGRTIPQALRDAYVLDVTTRAERAYRPQRYDGRLTIYRGSGLYVDPTLGWGSFAAAIDTREIPGMHRFRRQIVQEPAVHYLADALRRDLERAEAEGG